MYAHHFKSSRGQILIIVAVSLIVLIGFVGLAIDSGRAYGVKAKLNAAVDAAAIAAARGLADGSNDSARIASAKQAAKDYYRANFPTRYLGADLVPLTDADIVATHNQQDGSWTVAVTGAASMPVTFMGALGFSNVAVSATGQTIRPPWDVVLVLDTSGSLGPPTSSADTLPKLKQAAISFLGTFNSGSDLVGVVSFASGGVVDVPIVKNGTRGFVQSQVVNAINALSVTGSTAAAEGMRLALNDINGVPIASRSKLRSIVFFSDGAPNSVPAIFRNASAPVTGDLYSETDPPATDRATRVYRYDRRDTQLGTYTNIATLPNDGFALTNETGATVGLIPLASYNNMRTLSGSPYTNTRCNVNKAARSMVENVANSARSQGIKIYAVGLGARVNSLEISYCSYGAIERGSGILKRLANTADSDTFHAAPQPAGLYVWADSASDLNDAFMTIARAMIRLTK